MKIGLFDSGLGGLIITHSLVQSMPEYDYVYLGDTARVPYGNRSQEVIYEFTKRGVEYLFEHDCSLVILACNTASAEALRRLQHEYLPYKYPERRILGVLMPAAEEAVAQTHNGRIGVIATHGTVGSKAYEREIHKLNPQATVHQQATPLLVPLLENGGLKYVDQILEDYLMPLQKVAVDVLVLGCTHYPLLKKQIRDKMGPSTAIISQDEIIPVKLIDYLRRHPDLEGRLAKQGKRRFFVTDLAQSTEEAACQLFGEGIKLEKVDL